MIKQNDGLIGCAAYRQQSATLPSMWPVAIRTKGWNSMKVPVKCKLSCSVNELASSIPHVSNANVARALVTIKPMPASHNRVYVTLAARQHAATVSEKCSSDYKLQACSLVLP